MGTEMETSLNLPQKRQRLPWREYLAVCISHYKSYWKSYTVPLVVLIAMTLFIRVDVNYTHSLPDHVFITVKGWKSGLGPGDYVAYKFPTENPASPFRKGDHMVKLVLGTHGDVVKVDPERNVSIHRGGDRFAPFLGASQVGKAKPVSKAGKPLEAIAPGIVPESRFFVFAPHPDSLDSRYAMVGFISEDDIIGRTFPIF